VIVAHHMGEGLLPQLVAAGGSVPVLLLLARERVARLGRRILRRR
jgi:hypothetical protein